MMKTKKKVNTKTWMECQDIKLINSLKTVDEIVYPDGSKGELKGNFLIL